MCQDALLAFKVVSLMTISITQLGNVQQGIATNIQSFMLLHHPVLVDSCIIILFMLNLKNNICQVKKSLDCTVQFKST